jgi:hypothetical protein
MEVIKNQSDHFEVYFCYNIQIVFKRTRSGARFRNGRPWNLDAGQNKAIQPNPLLSPKILGIISSPDTANRRNLDGDFNEPLK